MAFDFFRGLLGKFGESGNSSGTAGAEGQNQTTAQDETVIPGPREENLSQIPTNESKMLSEIKVGQQKLSGEKGA